VAPAHIVWLGLQDQIAESGNFHLSGSAGVSPANLRPWEIRKIAGETPALRKCSLTQQIFELNFRVGL
jgi:hypothetical protein